MEIILVSDDKLKISLNRHDMDELGLKYKNMDYSDEKTKRALLLILEKAKGEVGFSPRGAKLFIEVYQNDEDGCNIYFTSIRRASRLSDSGTAISPTLFEFENANDLIDGSCKAFERYSHRIYRSSLYYINGKYRLLVYNLDYSDRLSVYFLSEYAKKISEDEIFAAYTIEHGKEIIADTAIDTLAKYFGPA